MPITSYNTSSSRGLEPPTLLQNDQRSTTVGLHVLLLNNKHNHVIQTIPIVSKVPRYLKKRLADGAERC